MYYLVKLHYKLPKEDTDELMKITKQFVVYAESVTEAEIRLQTWVPNNFKDVTVEEVKQTKIIKLHTDSNTETYWLVKAIYETDNQRSKPYFIVINGLNLDEVNKKLKLEYSDLDIEGVQKFKPLVDEDLISIEIKERKKENN